MDRGAWWATVHGIAKSQTQLSTRHTHMSRRQHPEPCPVSSLMETETSPPAPQVEEVKLREDQTVAMTCTAAILSTDLKEVGTNRPWN